MKKLILGMGLGIIMFLSTSMSVWAVCPGNIDDCVTDYFAARYIDSAGDGRGYIDFEQVQAVLIDYSGTSPFSADFIHIAFKDGSQSKYRGAGTADT